MTWIKVSNKKHDFNNPSSDISKYPKVRNKSIIQTVNKASYHKVYEGVEEVTTNPLFVGTEIILRYRKKGMEKTSGYNDGFTPIYVLNKK
ncbi:hypothetical protein P261_01513 [Lachnospiraceae bacterium TWA4]|nr:hypothetical protein P261_01513 [Lachnospiraceae bacterium TWA4]